MNVELTTSLLIAFHYQSQSRDEISKKTISRCKCTRVSKNYALLLVFIVPMDFSQGNATDAAESRHGIGAHDFQLIPEISQ